jgi:hypothetical protein
MGVEDRQSLAGETARRAFARTREMKGGGLFKIVVTAISTVRN